MSTEDRLILRIARAAYEKSLANGFSSFFGGEFETLADEVGASPHDALQARRRLEESGYLWESQHDFFRVMPALFLLHERQDRGAAYRQNKVRRHLLQETARLERESGGESYIQWKTDDEPYSPGELYTAARVLDNEGLIELKGDLPAIFNTTLTSRGYDASRDDRLLARLLPVNATEDEEAQLEVSPEALQPLIKNCEGALSTRGWKQALVEVQRGDNQFKEGDWVNAVREYYAAVESGLKYSIGAEDEPPSDEDDRKALNKLAKRAAAAGVIPTNYQALFGFTDSIRSPRSHGGGPKAQAGGEVEIGRAEALLMANHARSLLLYLAQRPPVT